MHSCKYVCIRLCKGIRHYATKQKILVELEESVNKNITDGTLNPKKHPGVINSKCITIPQDITESVKRALGDLPFKVVLRDSTDLVNYLKCRHPPPEPKQIRLKKDEAAKAVDDKELLNFVGLSADDVEKALAKRNEKIDKILKQRLYTWKAISYDKYMGLKYLVSRAAPEYAIIHKLFTEITSREKNYKPDSFFDFGSGVGTGIWAARQFWGESIREIFTVDTSPEMNDIARFILCDGVEGAEPQIKCFYQRQFLPATPSSYNVVLCAFSLFELPSAQNRLLTILNLWRKTKDFLILIEHGTNAGYSLITEARDFILEYKEEPLVGHVFSPCSHDLTCPRFGQDKTPCNFPIQYNKLKLSEKTERGEELFSYVILRKGERPADDTAWPRIVRPALLRSRHVICRMCCSDGKLSEVIFTPRKHGKVMYKCAKYSQWGDRLPISMSLEQMDDVEPNNSFEDENVTVTGSETKQKET